MCLLQFRMRKQSATRFYISRTFRRQRQVREEGTIAFDTANEAISLYVSREIITRWNSKIVISNPHDQPLPRNRNVKNVQKVRCL